MNVDHNLKVHKEIVKAWVLGWTLSRGTAPPVQIENAYRVDVGLPDHCTRYVLPQLDPNFLHDLTEQLLEPGTWLKICAPSALVAPLLSQAWSIKDTGHMMIRALRVMARPAPPDYLLVTTSDGAVLDVKMLDQAGEIAATGRIAVIQPFAVIDQVVTSPSHQRRGLGSFVMEVLCQHAAEQGAQTGVLVATDEGMALYRSLGWALHSVVTSAVIEMG
ncbi:GNAT family N-acetyltransferase [Solimicrobium silvestre]|uniref:Acetyltransferase (GNAT) family n=1 Tax=Solimicrobium silvestre TaxID=2099400 RepID=A0A2S9GT78_9BURK|nr:GNAT family N-acetyltransferase [Solimicrobium silvestre]PRC90915.1 Acetyltransferase (GNAT) family [Solimicrobium silvestre]